jgi:hypothetical protein
MPPSISSFHSDGCRRLHIGSLLGASTPLPVRRRPRSPEHQRQHNNIVEALHRSQSSQLRDRYPQLPNQTIHISKVPWCLRRPLNLAERFGYPAGTVRTKVTKQGACPIAALRKSARGPKKLATSCGSCSCWCRCWTYSIGQLRHSCWIGRYCTASNVAQTFEKKDREVVGAVPQEVA